MNKKKFIIIRIFGGLGNQLWQYAVGRALSLKYKKRLVLDISYFKNPLIDNPKGGKYKFELNKFNLHKDTLIEKDCYNHSYRFAKYFLNYLPNKIVNIFFKDEKFKIKKFIFEDDIFKKKNFDKLIRNNKTVYLIGYWQSIKYLLKYHEIIKNESKPKIINKQVKKFIKNITTKNVALHIRGGDMSITKSYTDKKYYFKIFNFLKQKKTKFDFHIFTDDPIYAKFFLRKIELKNYKIISNTYNFSNIEEFYIMQHYRHLAINRSTFSWWSGYLSNLNKTIIFAPKFWSKRTKSGKFLIMSNYLRTSNMILM